MTNTRTWLGGIALVALTAAVTSAVATQRADSDAAAKHSRPAPEHDVLDTLWGKWHFAVKIQADDGDVEVISLNADYRWELGGRFLIGSYDGYIDGQRFQAREILGYDSFRGEYRSFWVDNNSTAFTLASGKYDARKRTLTFEGVQDDVEKNLRDQPFTVSYRFVDHDRFDVEVWRPGPDGKMVKGTTVNATRIGAEDN